jgi:serine/threonine protein kinase
MKKIYHRGDLINDRYQILKIIGREGVGVTYSADDLQLKQKVAIKVVFLTDIIDWKILELFKKEAKILKNLDHPNIPKYLDYFENNLNNQSYFYLVQELITGESLAQLVENKREFTENQIKDIARQILKILVYLQGLNPPLIHRDIKPQNIILTPENIVYLVDFGTVQDVYRNTISIGGTFVGTFGYMPPEQFRGQTLLSSDLYSLGATLIFLITEKSPADLPQKNLKIDFAQYAKISYSLRVWLEKMVEPIYEDRFSSATEALESLETDLSSVTLTLGERIKIDKQSSKLSVAISCLGWKFITYWSFIKSLTWNSFFVLIPWHNLLKNIFTKGFFQINIFVMFLLFCSTLFGIYLIIKFVNQLLSYNLLEFTPSKFKIYCKSPTMKTNKVGNTSDVVRLERLWSIEDKFQEYNSIILWHGIKSYLIAENLTRLEAENLLKFLETFFRENGLNIDIKIY